MRLSLATNLDEALLDGIEGLPVEDLYGKLPADAVGGGRATYMLAPASKRKFARHVASVRARGYGFHYLLNAACLDNLEWTRGFQRRLRGLLDWVSEIGCTGVVVSLPYLCEAVKATCPSLAVWVGVFARVDSAEKARWWEKMGAAGITIDAVAANRDFAVLRRIRAAVRCDLQLLANNNCLAACPWYHAHAVLLSHASQTGHASSGFVLDHCYLRCSTEKIRDPVRYLKSDWIRPEDLHHYEAIGLDRFKIVERDAPTLSLLRRVRAYAARRYDGNLLDLVQGYGFPAEDGPQARAGGGLFWSIRTIFRRGRPTLSALRRLRRLAEIRGMLVPRRGPGGLPGAAPVVLENTLLDGFLDPFVEGRCDHDCDRCGHCPAYAARAVRIDAAHRRDVLSLADGLLSEAADGRLWN